MSSSPTESTQEPIYKAATTVGTAIATGLGVLGGAVQLGVISSDQADTITQIGNQVTTQLPALAGAVTVIVGIVSGVGASVLTAWHARKKVVPVNSDTFTVSTQP
jgi:hypothetical protein